MRSFNRLREGNKEKDDLFYTLIDILDIGNLDPKQAARYIQKLEDTYGYKYAATDYEHLITTANPKRLAPSTLFPDYNRYREYALAVFTARKYKPNTLDEIWNPITINEVQEIFLQGGLDTKVILNNRADTLAYSTCDDVVIPEKISRGVVIHELGHAVQHVEGYLDGLLLDIAYAPSKYGTTNGGECFAEGFLHFFTDRSYPDEFPDCYTEFDRIVPTKVKRVVEVILSL